MPGSPGEQTKVRAHWFSNHSLVVAQYSCGMSTPTNLRCSHRAISVVVPARLNGSKDQVTLVDEKVQGPFDRSSGNMVG